MYPDSGSFATQTEYCKIPCYNKRVLIGDEECNAKCTPECWHVCNNKCKVVCDHPENGDKPCLTCMKRCRMYKKAPKRCGRIDKHVCVPGRGKKTK